MHRLGNLTQKGGVGKPQQRLCRLAIHREKLYWDTDTDPHASLTSYMGCDSDELVGTLLERYSKIRVRAGFLAISGGVTKHKSSISHPLFAI